MGDERDEIPGDAWPYWPVALAAGGTVDVLGAGPCHAPFALARTLPRGGWHRAASPAEAIAAASGVTVQEARAAFLSDGG